MTGLPTHNIDHNIDLRPLTADIVSAYVSKNPVSATSLPDVIAGTYAALVSLGAAPPAQQDPTEPEVVKPTAAEIRKSITPDSLISFIDGKARRTLRRHLTNHGLTPQQYRARYGLPVDYPIVAASYSAKRSDLAKATGLGQRSAQAAAAE